MATAVATPVLLVLGAGPNVGAALGRLFGKHGYKVALASRRVTDGPASDGTLHVQVDLSQPETVSQAFEKVTSALGPPHVVIYNAASNTSTPSKSPLDLAHSLPSFLRDQAVNVTSALVAAHEATRAFDALSSPSPVSSEPAADAVGTTSAASRTFIYTGNILNSEPILPLLSLGIGKSSAAHMINAASLAHRGRGYKFYYADERNADGSVAGAKIDGEAHAAFYWELAQKKEQGEWWLATFVKGKGHVAFEGTGFVKNAAL